MALLFCIVLTISIVFFVAYFIGNIMGIFSIFSKKKKKNATFFLILCTFSFIFSVSSFLFFDHPFIFGDVFGFDEKGKIEYFPYGKFRNLREKKNLSVFLGKRSVVFRAEKIQEKINLHTGSIKVYFEIEDFDKYAKDIERCDSSGSLSFFKGLAGKEVISFTLENICVELDKDKYLSFLKERLNHVFNEKGVVIHSLEILDFL